MWKRFQSWSALIPTMRTCVNIPYLQMDIRVLGPKRSRVQRGFKCLLDPSVSGIHFESTAWL